MRTDARLATTIERGMHERLYFASTRVPRAADETIAEVRERWMPITSPVRDKLIDIVNHRLRPPVRQAALPNEARAEREAYEEALRHRPERTRPLR